MIVLRFVAHPGLFTWATQIAEYGFWATHCEALTPDGKLLGSMYVDGVQARDRNYDGRNFQKEMFLTVKTSQSQEDAFFAFLHGQIGKPYDVWSIVTFFGKRDWQARDSWYCADLIAAALASCGLFPSHLAVEFNRVTPRDLMLLISTLAEVG